MYDDIVTIASMFLNVPGQGYLCGRGRGRHPDRYSAGIEAESNSLAPASALSVDSAALRLCGGHHRQKTQHSHLNRTYQGA